MADDLSNDELIARAELGEAGRAFVDSELGKVMLGLAAQEVQLALEALALVEPTETEKVRKHQIARFA